ncbi:MAG: hypothetical protein JJU05_10110 [Verrucomicrobia bacterium]|nr:hypothetical protein [Verrucomicrobiota bacterium]MCH8526642.1 hypothetical protein [Kiritimatiellia bacterium]
MKTSIPSRPAISPGLLSVGQRGGIRPGLLLLAGLLLGVFAGGSLHASSEAYDQATAGNPDFRNRDVWPMLNGDERFVQQEWPEGRVLEWAHPGKSGGPNVRGGLDIWDPDNWLVNGEPATEVSTDEDTDLYFPDSDTPYSVVFLNVEGWSPIYRHVTVGRNARVVGLSNRFYGNIWVKKGGSLFGSHGNNYLGGAHTFLRHDESDPGEPRGGRFGQYLTLNKSGPDVSMEIIGTTSVLDRVNISSGTLIIGQGSRFSPGRNATMVIGEGATVALRDGATLGKWLNQLGQVDFTVFGTLQGGLPERPLQGPAYVRLSYQNTTEVQFFDKLTPPGGSSMETRIAPLIMASGSTLRSYSGSPEGRLHLRLTDADAKDWHMAGDAGYRDWVNSLSEEELAYLEQQLDSIPKKIVSIFQEDVTVDGVVFNDFHKGGILMEDIASARQWRNSALGTGNAAEGHALFRQIGRADVRDNVKSAGGEYTLGVPVIFAKETFQPTDAWQVAELKVKIPDEAGGHRLGVRFTHSGSGWGYVDNVKLLIEGKDWIVNGDFNQPGPREDGRRRSFGQVVAWEDMANPNPAAGVNTNEEGRSYGATHTSRSAFGQTTDARPRSGQTATLIFEYSASARSRMKAELYYIAD